MILSNGSVGRFDENDVWIEIEEGLTDVQMEELADKVTMYDRFMEKMRKMCEDKKK